MTAQNSLLHVQDLDAWHGTSHVVREVSFDIGAGECLAIMGRNGVGKTSTVLATAGLLRRQATALTFDGKDLLALPAHQGAREGLVVVPQGRHIWTPLTVEENLRVARRKTSSWSISDVFELFPRLGERRRNAGGALSGGEQQMLALGRALMTGPRLLVLDEPFEGIAPKVIDGLLEKLLQLRSTGLSVLLVEQNLSVVVAMADHVKIMDRGQFVWDGDLASFRSSGDRIRTSLGV